MIEATMVIAALGCLLGGYILSDKGQGAGQARTALKMPGLSVHIYKIGPGMLYAVLGVVLLVMVLAVGHS